ncbi:MAG: TrkA family potassium uptake protein [Candidatus Aminicenantes bacterium]|nr:TrkA family potassium uptake protein [Candidatus Aminicenantes bacterium]OQX54801.1 MAG: potassium transporter TrkA [Candidatus Aminicenantes bacterium 4484_214]RLE02466.1 MAG: TrkA family potassium uptake protein [Candidatus Aminicenantes bacterium]RLE05244.1 MAG: TrkA family potassium uptake protein [Candidatus Aminicenantes bacterium]
MKFAVIGLGSFGSNIAKTLYEKNNEVLAIDIDKERVEAVKGFVSHAVCMDSADKENLEALGVREMDVVIVSLGPEMEASILTVLYLHELGVKRIIAKALSEDHAKILEAVGATEVIYPEKDMAIRTALRLSNPNILEYLPLISGFSIQELAPPEKFIGKSLRELDLRNKYGIQVIAIKELIPDKITFIPSADFVIKDSDILIILGEEKQLARLNSQSKS